MQERLIAIDIFSGAGGMSIGAKLAGIIPVLAVEFEKNAAQTYSNNHPETVVLNRNIIDIDPLKYIKKYPFLLIGGPPCQGFSVANTKTRNLKNSNNFMFEEYLRFVKDLKPKWFVFENVQGFKSFNKGEFAEFVELELKNLGYETSSCVLDASKYGVPQNRKRFFIIGNKKVGNKGIKFNFENLKQKPIVSVKEAIFDLPSMDNGETSHKKKYKDRANSDYSRLMRKHSSVATQNYLTKNKDHIIDRYKVIKEGENWVAAKRNGHLDSYTSTKHTHSGIYKRLEQDKPSVTIANYRKSMLIHPIEHRGLSLREAARLQSFPDDFEFSGPLSYQQQQVGNAVPPLLAQVIFEEIIRLEKRGCGISINDNTISSLS